MHRSNLTSSPIQARPRHVLGWGFDLFVGDELLVTMNMDWLREGGSFNWNDRRYQLRRQRLWTGDFLLCTDDMTIARATKTSPFVRTFILELSAGKMVLSAVHPLTRAFQLMEGDEIIGTIKPRYILTRHCTIQLPGKLSLPEQVFVLWLTVLMWRRSAHSSH